MFFVLIGWFFWPTDRGEAQRRHYGYFASYSDALGWLLRAEARQS